MSDSNHFNKLAEKGNPVGEVIGVERFLVKIRGLQPVNAHALHHVQHRIGELAAALAAMIVSICCHSATITSSPSA